MRTGAAWLVAVMVILIGSLLPLVEGSTAAMPDWGWNLGHLPAYGLFALVTARLLILRGWAQRRAEWSTMLAGLALGLLIELIQPSVGRHLSLQDLLADGVGLAIGLVLGRLLFGAARG